MPDYRPIPGQTDRGPSSPMNPRMDDLSVMAKEKASNILSPYANMGSQPNTNPVPPPAGTAGQAAPGAEAGPSTEKMLYNSVPTDTLSRILDVIMQFVGAGKKPIPRQEGGPVEPDKDYIVGEGGPERFRPAVPGQIIPREGGYLHPTPMGPERGLMYSGRMSEADIMGKNVPPPSSAEFSKWELAVPGAEETRPTRGIPPYTGPRPWRQPPGVSREAPPDGRGKVPGPDPFQGYGGWSEPETAETRRGDILAKERIAREGRGFVPIPGQGPGPGGSYLRSYYEAHPEEKSMDDLVAQYGHRDPKTGNITNLKELAELHKTNVEFGPQSIQSQERLARMDYEKAEAEAKRAGIPFEQYLKTAEAEKNLGEAAKSGFISGKWGVFHPATGQFFIPPGMEDKATATTMMKLESEAAKETGGDPIATRERLRSKVKSLVDMGLLKKADIPPQFFKMTKHEFMAALQRAKKIPKNQDELDKAYQNYMKIPIED